MLLKRGLRWFAFILAIFTATLWLSLGGHRGWTKTSVPIPKKDPVTEQDYVAWEPRFVPGVDMLALGLAGSLVCLVASSLLAKRPRKSKTP